MGDRAHTWSLRMHAQPAHESPRTGWIAVLHEMWNADPLTLAASIAFYTALSFAPIIVLAVVALAHLSPGQERHLVDQLESLFGHQVGAAAQLVMDNADASSIHLNMSGMLAGGALLFSATSAFAQLQEALNRIWGVRLPDGNPVVSWLRRRLFSLGILAVIGFLLVTALVISTVLGLLLSREGIWWAAVNELVTLGVLGLAFACLYRFVPDEVPSWHGAMIGGAVTAVLFEAGKWGLGAYLASTTSDDAYGGASALILLLLWVYYSALIVLAGAAFTRLVAQWRGWALRPRRRAETTKT